VDLTKRFALLLVYKETALVLDELSVPEDFTIEKAYQTFMQKAQSITIPAKSRNA